MEPLAHYRCFLPGQFYKHLHLTDFSYVEASGFGLLFYRTNVKRVRCTECGAFIEPSEAIQRQHLGVSGRNFICLPCARALILQGGPRGYHENAAYQIRPNDWGTEDSAQFTAQQVAESIRRNNEE